MAFIPAKCTQCGANITVDNTKEAGICEFCGTAFITEKAINNYTINNIYNIQNANITIPTKNIENLRTLADDEYKNGRYESADSYYRQILEINGDDYECLFRRALCMDKLQEPHARKFYPMYEYLDRYVACVEKDKITPKEDKNKKIDFGFSECISLVFKYHHYTMTENFIDGKVKSTNIYILMCGYTFKACINLMDKMEPFIDQYECVVENWKNACILAELALKIQAKRHYSVDGKTIHGLSETGAKAVYEDAQKLREYALKVTKDYLLPSELIPSKDGGKGINTGGCYIATCVYGSYDCPQVWTLRRFRDNTLDETWYGRVFIKCYYAISPKLVKWFGNQRWFRNLWKAYLDKAVTRLNLQGVKNTQYIDKY